LTKAYGDMDMKITSLCIDYIELIGIYFLKIWKEY